MNRQLGFDLWMFVGVILVVAACGGVDNLDTSATPPLPPISTPSPNPEPTSVLPQGVLFEYSAGMHSVEIEDWDTAISRLSFVVRVLPDFAKARYGLAMAHYKNGNLDRAIKEFTLILNDEPENTEALYGRAIAYRDNRQIDNAMADLKDVLNHYPNSEIRDKALRLLDELQM